MSSDNMVPRPAPPFRAVGVGVYSNFCCAACGNRRSVLGRRLQRVNGVRQFVCKACVR